MLKRGLIGAGGTLGGREGWNVSTAVFVQGFSVGSIEFDPRDVFFKPDGMKMYIIGTSGDDVNEFDLSVAWDVSTAVYLQAFSISAQEATATGVFFDPDGIKMYVIGISGDKVNEYNLSVAWDVSTAVYLQAFSISAQETTPTALFFKPDGKKMYVMGASGDKVNEYNLSVAWDVSTAVYLQAFSVFPQETQPYGLFFKPDGTKMYVVGGSSRTVFEYDLTA